MLLAVTIVICAGAASVAAGWLLWRGTRLGGGWALVAGPILGLGVVLAAILLGYVLARLKGPAWG